MARKLRIEYAGAMYHVINRGNHRSWIFETEGARRSFRLCLQEACGAMEWRLHAWVLMGNHYHLCLETPSPNLVEGMRWLQSTFANRFNRFRQTNGHVFQGRYKAMLLDGDAVGAVCHYIHLNPVRAGLIEAGKLEDYWESSFARLWRPRKREACEVPETALLAAGGLADTPAGRRSYRDYLVWLSGEEGERKRLGFEKMSRGWAKGWTGKWPWPAACANATLPRTAGSPRTFTWVPRPMCKVWSVVTGPAMAAFTGRPSKNMKNWTDPFSSFP